MAQLLAILTASFGKPVNLDLTQPIHLEILSALGELEIVVDEAERERATRLASAPDPAPLPRTLHRVRNDLVMIGRAVPEPLPDPLGARLQAMFSEASAELIKLFQGGAVALRKRKPAPPRDALEAAFDHFNIALMELRELQLIRTQSAEMAGRVFALSFAFQQLRANVKDLVARISERAV